MSVRLDDDQTPTRPSDLCIIPTTSGLPDATNHLRALRASFMRLFLTQSPHTSRSLSPFFPSCPGY